MPPSKPFPRPVAVFNDRFIFTTLTEKEITQAALVPFHHPTTLKSCSLFTLDDRMAYQPFHKDHGPLNLAYTFEACVWIHERLESKKWAQTKPVCLYTSTEPKQKANITLIVALYHVIVGHQEPQEAFHAIAKMEVMPFRDAGNGEVDHGLYIQDCLYGIHKAMEVGLLDLATFDKESYRFFERVENGDLNLLGPFIPFASPYERSWMTAAKTASQAQKRGQPFAWPPAKQTRIESKALQFVLKVFTEENVGLVVRLNDALYDKRHFLDAGMDHIEMFFEDGSNPSDEIVRAFIDLAEHWIVERGCKVAVHCKAGLGRTGVLIGAYLIYKYHFTAQEVISYMRIVRPGMVVGAQQQYMLHNQMKWVAWSAKDEAIREMQQMSISPREEPVNPLATPPAEPEMLLPPSAMPLRTINPPQNSIMEQVATRLLTDKAEQPLRPLGDTSTRATLPKNMDAVGQPRKSPARSPVRGEAYPSANGVVEPVNILLRSPSPEPSAPAIARPPGRTASRTASAEAPTLPYTGSQGSATVRPSRAQVAASTTSSSASTRGVKRGATRLPIPEMASPEHNASVKAPRLGVPSSPVHRSTSISSIASSVASEVARPAKKRLAQGRAPTSPLGRAGMSSPPPSRESSPAAEDIEMETKVWVGVNGPTPPLRVANKLRRKVALAPPVDQSTAATDQAPSTPPNSAEIISSPASTGGVRRSLIPSIRSVPPKDRQLGQPMPALDEVVERTKRRTFTPPRVFGLGPSR